MSQFVLHYSGNFYFYFYFSLKAKPGVFLFVGKNPTDEYLDAMMNEAPGPINFTMFLTMFGEKLNGTDPEDVIRNAFACFDEEATGMWAKLNCFGVFVLVIYDISVAFKISRCETYNATEFDFPLQ